MGADIYYDGPHYKEEQRLWEAYQNEKNEAEKEFHWLKLKKFWDTREDADYFRDSYNNTSVLWQMGLSWWQDVGKVLDDEGLLPIAEAIKLRDYIEKHPIVREEITWEDWDTKKPVVFSDEERDEWFEYFTKKRQDFLDMLDRSIENNSPLICSV